jgi:prepilin peptidase CpaA
MTELVFIAASMLLLVATYCDMRTREIPDGISIALFLLAIGAAAVGAANVQWWMVLSGGLLGLAIGAALFRFAELGGGDAKLLAAIGALLGPVGLLFVLFWMALAGGVLALLAMVRGQRDYAYVPAIAAGYLAYLVWPVGLFQRLVP